MKLKILAIGQKMPTWVETGFKEYHKRIQPMMSTDIIELPPAKRSKTHHLPRLITTKTKKAPQY